MLNRRDALIGLGALSIGSAYAFWPTARKGPEDLPNFLDISASAQEAPSIEVEDFTLGDVNAPVKMIEYASFTCGHCGNFHNDTFKDFRTKYIDTGKVHFTYREVYFDRYALWAGLLARCGGEARYFGLVDLIYQTQAEWSRAGDPVDVATALQKLGLQAGLDQETLDACMQDAPLAEALVARYRQNAERDNVTGTPTFIIDGESYSGNRNLEQLSVIIDAALDT